MNFLSGERETNCPSWCSWCCSQINRVDKKSFKNNFKTKQIFYVTVFYAGAHSEWTSPVWRSNSNLDWSKSRMKLLFPASSASVNKFVLSNLLERARQRHQVLSSNIFMCFHSWLTSATAVEKLSWYIVKCKRKNPVFYWKQNKANK